MPKPESPKGGPKSGPGNDESISLALPGCLSYSIEFCTVEDLLAATSGGKNSEWIGIVDSDGVADGKYSIDGIAYVTVRPNGEIAFFPFGTYDGSPFTFDYEIRKKNGSIETRTASVAYVDPEFSTDFENTTNATYVLAESLDTDLVWMTDNELRQDSSTYDPGYVEVGPESAYLGNSNTDNTVLYIEGVHGDAGNLYATVGDYVIGQRLRVCFEYSREAFEWSGYIFPTDYKVEVWWEGQLMDTFGDNPGEQGVGLSPYFVDVVYGEGLASETGLLEFRAPEPGRFSGVLDNIELYQVGLMQ